MKRGITWILLTCIMVASLVLASCTTKTTSSTPTSTTTSTITTTSTLTSTTKTTTAQTTITTTTTATGNWWDKFGTPQYGGIITARLPSDPINFDNYLGEAGDSQSPYSEELGMRSWTADPETEKISYHTPSNMQGLLAESWEQQDTQTLIFHIRKGVYWQNLPPVNGRLLTAHDIEWNYDRMLGLGDGFTKPAPTVGLGQWAMIKSITATDNYTVVFKSSYPSLDMLNSLLDPNQPNYIEAPEEVQAWGNTADWHHTVGTGPFILKDYVSGSSLTYIKNPNYWGYDERHPENRLPYVDGLEALIIPDQSTFMAGVRSGKIDLIDTLTLVQAENMAKTNPDITQFKLPNNAFCLLMRDDKAPFTDIRVREALQMAVDLPTIAATYYQGVVDGTPYPLCGPYLTGDYYPYAEWPQQLKDTYTYNVAGAKQLLADAGYPNGFNTTLAEADSGRTSDTDLCQIVKSYFSAIGVNMTINVMSAANFQVLTRVSRSVDQMAFTGTGALTYPPLISILNRDSTQASSLNCVHDPVYDKMCDAASAATDLAQQTTLIQQCDKYAVEHHWDVVLPQTVTFNLCQPWLEGYSGEFILNSWGAYMSRWWINQDIKKGK